MEIIELTFPMLILCLERLFSVSLGLLPNSMSISFLRLGRRGGSVSGFSDVSSVQSPSTYRATSSCLMRFESLCTCPCRLDIGIWLSMLPKPVATPLTDRLRSLIPSRTAISLSTDLGKKICPIDKSDKINRLYKQRYAQRA